MSEQVVAIIAWIAGISVAIPTYRWARHRKPRKRKFIEKAKKTGHYVNGEYADSKLRLGDSNSKNSYLRDESVRVRYKYVVNGIDYYKSLTFQTVGLIGTDFPYRVTVYYDANNPKKAVCLEETHSKKQIQTGCFTMIAAMVITMYAVYFGIKLLIG